MHSFTIPEWCKLEKISRGEFYKLRKEGKGPRTYNIGKCVRITPEAAAQFRRDREAESAGADA